MRRLAVAAVDDTFDGIRTLTLVDPDGGALPSFTPGSHLVVECAGPGSPVNAYSLTGEATAPAAYVISVLRAGRDGAPSGSRWIHDELTPGDTVLARPPRSAFPPILRARRHLLVAAGIGITPMVSHLRSARLWGRDARLLYIHRRGRGVYADLVRELTEHVSIHTRRADLVAELTASLADQPLGTHLYVCGPAGFIDVVTASAVELGWRASRIHVEHFGIDALDPGEPFAVRLSSDAEEFTVDAGVSLLDALEGRGIEVPNLCRRGVCGECRIPVSGGVIEHRDLYLTDDEKNAGDSMMACVSRARGQSLELAL
ncbi:PDR/VanB family oxidoreductase [Mycobacterium sp. 4D054]|uniref:PDR/VanB family oxidoreductase n=1 Tax=Mycobacterium sp. 4D054 TaxID=3457440 RepID=UPI003FD04CBE